MNQNKQTEQIEKMVDELLKIAEAINSYTGNELSNYQSFRNLMTEEKINLLADAITGLIMLKALSLKKEQE